MKVRRNLPVFVLVACLTLVGFFLHRPTATEAQNSRAGAVFTNPTSIAINSSTVTTIPSVAVTYPSQIAVSGMTGTITRVAVTLDGMFQSQMNNFDVLLVSPAGAKFIVMSDAGGSAAVADRKYTFADDAATTMSIFDLPQTGSYKPTDYGTQTDIFPAPAPAGPYETPPAATFASVFNGQDPNGGWSLYVVTDGARPGSIRYGWSVTITTSGSPQTFSNANSIELHDRWMPSEPYGTAINVSGLGGVIANLRVSLTGFSHPRPVEAEFLLVNSNGASLMLMARAGGSTPVQDVNLVFDDDASGTVFNPITSGTYRPTENFGSVYYFPSPAPPTSLTSTGASQLNRFNGFSPNGEWRLFVIDGQTGNSGSLSGGWGLEIETVPAPPAPTSTCVSPSFSASSFSAGVGPANMAVADFNGDGHADIVTANQVSNDLSVLLGNGDGTFDAAVSVAAGASPYAIVAGKFNGDKHFDLAVTNSGSNTVSIFLGNGEGTFASPTSFFVGSAPLSIAAGNLNGDANADLVVANFGGFFSGTVSLLFGNGNGSFTSGGSLRTRSQPSAVAVADINGDTFTDIIVANFGSDSISTFFGNGSGSFGLAQNVTVGSGPVALEIFDMNGNGRPDVVVANYNSDTVSTCLTNAAGTLSCSTNLAGGANPIGLASGDFLGSGMRTFATALSGSNNVRLLISNIQVGQNPNAIRAADFNGDGRLDLATANFGSDNVSILLNQCSVATGNIFDFNGDRRTDIAVFRPSNSYWYNQQVVPNGGLFIDARPDDLLVPADYNGDGRTDYAYFRPETGIWHIQQDVRMPIYFTQFGLPGDIPVPADYDGDGKADIAVWRPSTGQWYIRQSTTNVTQVFQFGLDGDKPAQGDFDGDGIADLAIFRPSTGVWYIWRSTDSGFTIRQFGLDGDIQTVGDYDGDGKADVAVFRPSTSVWYVLRSSDMNFTATAWGIPGDVPLIGDFDGDGKYDHAVWRPSDRIWYILKSSDGAATYESWGSNGDRPLPSSFVR